MLSIEMFEAITVKEKNLVALMALIESPVRMRITETETVKSEADVIAPKRRGRPRKVEATAPAEGVAEKATEPQAEAQAGEAPKRRGRPLKAKPGEAVAEAKPATGDLTARFTKLVEDDYEKAAELLEAFGIKQLSELPEDSAAEFSTALDEVLAVA